jgi:Tfp pilus assembly protein PilV
MDSSVRSNKPEGRRAQSGQSLVEAVVAAAVLGVGFVTALTALDTMLFGANEATQQAWATCAVRAEAGLLEAASWKDNDEVQQYPSLDHVFVTLSPQSPAGNPELQILDVTARDSAGRTAATATVWKANVLSGGTPNGNETSPGAWCSYMLRAAP